METNPNVVDGLHQRGTFLVGHFRPSVPSGATVDHVEDNMFSVEQQVEFDLLIEGVG
jgi:hypothetical protein